jgi:hypothetical protein
MKFVKQLLVNMFYAFLYGLAALMVLAIPALVAVEMDAIHSLSAPSIQVVLTVSMLWLFGAAWWLFQAHRGSSAKNIATVTAAIVGVVIWAGYAGAFVLDTADRSLVTGLVRTETGMAFYSLGITEELAFIGSLLLLLYILPTALVMLGARYLRRAGSLSVFRTLVKAAKEREHKNLADDMANDLAQEWSGPEVLKPYTRE